MASSELAALGFLLLIQVIGYSQAYFEQCKHSYNLNADSVATLKSPYYTDRYPAGSSCLYEIIAPMDYEIYVNCTIALDKGPNACTTEKFYVATDGDETLTSSLQFCGTGIKTYTSLFRKLVIAYTSDAAPGSTAGGSFICKLTTRPQACDCGWKRNTRIVGGTDAELNEFPSMTALYHMPSASVYCGGAIIHHHLIITATHCARYYSDASEILAIVGDHILSSGTESPYAASYPIGQIIEAPGYDPVTNVNDLALLVTTVPIEWSLGVGPICLPLDQLTNNFDYENVNLVGWGSTSFSGSKSDTLQKAAVNILPNSDCQTVYPDLVSKQMCTYYPNRDACQFDSGGPVIRIGSVRQFLLAIITHGYACGINPGVNTRLTSFVSWIQDYTGATFCAKPYN